MQQLTKQNPLLGFFLGWQLFFCRTQNNVFFVFENSVIQKDSHPTRPVPNLESSTLCFHKEVSESLQGHLRGF